MFEEIEIRIISMRENVSYLVGKNAEGNFKIIDMAEPNDIWFHIDGSPSSHIIARMKDNKITKKQKNSIIIQGSLLCKKFSKCKCSIQKTIIYTEVKNVRKTEIIGSVIASNLRNRSV